MLLFKIRFFLIFCQTVCRGCFFFIDVFMRMFVRNLKCFYFTKTVNHVLRFDKNTRDQNITIVETSHSVAGVERTAL